MTRRFLAPLLFLALGANAFAADVTARLLSRDRVLERGKPFWVAVELTMAPGWHTYWKDPGESGLPTKIKWTLPPGVSAGEIQWPLPARFETGPLVNYGYAGTVWLPVLLTPSEKTAGSAMKLRARVDWLGCKEECIPGRAELSLSIPLGDLAVPGLEAERLDAVLATLPTPEQEAAVSRGPPTTSGGGPTTANPWLAFVFAFLGGLLLNLMPCVLPVLSLKLLGMVQHQTPTERRAGAWFYTLGIFVFFAVLTAVLLGLRAGGQQLGWGFQLQSPRFVSFLAMLFFVLGLSQLGFFEVGSGLVRLGGVSSGQRGALSSFLSGALAVLVATPCTAPFMGPALGFALTQPGWIVTGVFFSLAGGLALPFLLFAYIPALFRWVPKPGPWMDYFKKIMGFLLLGTTLFLLDVLGRQMGTSGILRLLVSLWALSFAIWLWGARAGLSGFRQKLLAVLAVGGLLLSLSLAFRPEGKSQVTWEPYSEARLSALQGENRPVFVDFTAAWCVTCQVNKRTTLTTDVVERAFLEHNVALLRADWTRHDADVTRALEALGRNAVPVYAFYEPGSREPVLLPTLLTPTVVLDALKKGDQNEKN